MVGYLDMGGYGPFIWPAYLVVCVLLLAFALHAWRALRRAQADLTALEARGLGQRRRHDARGRDVGGDSGSGGA